MIHQTNTVVAPAELSCVFGDNVKSGVVKPIVYQSLRSFAGWLKNLAPVAAKEDSRYIVGASFSGSQRTLRDMLCATIIQLDFDKPTSGEQMASVLAVLEGLGVAHIAFDTFSNGGRFVVLIPLARGATAAEHKATLDYLVAELGPYGAGLDQASFNPVLPRFISPNANSPTRTITLFEAPYLQPIAVANQEALPDNVTPITPIPARAAVTDRFALFSEQASPHEQQLFLVALRHNLLPTPRLAEYPQWFPVVFACFRAWAVNSHTLTESQRAMWEVLEGWSKLHPKWKPDALKNKLTDWLRDRGQGMSSLHIQSILTHEVGASELRSAIQAEAADDFDLGCELMIAADKLLGATPVEVVDTDALAAAVTQRKARDEAADKLRMRGLTILSRAPQINERFTRFVDLLVALSTQNKAELWELDDDKWSYFLRPAPMLISLCQMYAMGFAPHVMFRLSDTIEPKALNIYFLNIAPAGTGKSATMNTIHQVITSTVFKNLSPSYKLHSATGLWINAFERHGPLQLVTSDEAESLIGKHGVKDQHLLALQTSVKQLYDAGIPGRKFRPSAQVQRELREITAPVMSLNLAATPALLREDLGSAMLNDGFVSRMIVSIDDREINTTTPEESIARTINLITSTPNNTLENTTADVVKFFNESWRSPAAAHPAGREFFSVMGDEAADELAGRISAHFERTDLVVRYITPPKDPKLMYEYAAMLDAASRCWIVPHGMKGTDVESNIASLRVRSENKLSVLSSILTLVADPSATEINLPLMRWAADVLYTTQYPFYKHLLESADVTLSTKSRLNPSFIDKLRPAIIAGGPLREGSVSTSTLNKFSRAWRKLISDLKLPEINERRRAAEEALELLEVSYHRVGKGVEFYMTKDLDNV